MGGEAGPFFPFPSLFLPFFPFLFLQEMESRLGDLFSSRIFFFPFNQSRSQEFILFPLFGDRTVEGLILLLPEAVPLASVPLAVYGVATRPATFFSFFFFLVDGELMDVGPRFSLFSYEKKMKKKTGPFSKEKLVCEKSSPGWRLTFFPPTFFFIFFHPERPCR